MHENENARKVSDTIIGVPFNVRMGASSVSSRNTSRGWIDRVVSRSTSIILRSGLSATSVIPPAATASSTAQFHPNATATGATISPASAPPAGAPACLIENISERCCFGAVAAKIRLPDGGVGP